MSECAYYKIMFFMAVDVLFGTAIALYFLPCIKNHPEIKKTMGFFRGIAL